MQKFELRCHNGRELLLLVPFMDLKKNLLRELEDLVFVVAEKLKAI